MDFAGEIRGRLKLNNRWYRGRGHGERILGNLLNGKGMISEIVCFRLQDFGRVRGYLEGAYASL